MAASRRMVVAGLAGLALTAGLGSRALAARCAQPSGAQALRAGVVDLVNAQRTANGRVALGRNDRLERAAQDHACWIAATGKYGHKGANGSTPKGRVKAAGYRSCLTAENVAWGQSGAGQVVAEWMGSSGHKANILNRKLTDVGVGVSVLQGRLVWVLVFARAC